MMYKKVYTIIIRWIPFERYYAYYTWICELFHPIIMCNVNLSPCIFINWFISIQMHMHVDILYMIFYENSQCGRAEILRNENKKRLTTKNEVP